MISHILKSTQRYSAAVNHDAPNYAERFIFFSIINVPISNPFTQVFHLAIYVLKDVSAG